MMPGQKRCEPSSVWTEKNKVWEISPGVLGGATVRLATTCGTANTQIFGEIMLVAGTNWEGSYANNHPARGSNFRLDETRLALLACSQVFLPYSSACSKKTTGE